LSAGPLPIADPVAEQEVLREVGEMIVSVIGEDYLLDVEIEMTTSFQDDLEIESIEFVALAEQLHERYGGEVDFVAWLADKELDEIIALTVGELVTFIAGCRIAA
jgi:acyl carrier protein